MPAAGKSDVTTTTGDDHVAVVEIHRPPDNYFDLSLITALADAFETLADERRCRAIVLCSEGKHFCAGANFNPAPGDSHDLSRPGGPSALYEQAVRLVRATKPVVAAVQGAAIGGGLGLACVADFRIGCPESRFSANFARLGFHQGFGLTVTLPEIVGRQHALEMFLTGRRVPGEEAAQMGLCDRLVPADKLRAEARLVAGEIAASAPLAVLAIRATMRDGLAERFEAATKREAAEQERLWTTSDFAEGVRAAAARDEPEFRGT